MNKIQGIIEEIKRLEDELLLEIQKKEDEFFYKIKGKRVVFEEETKRYHKTFVVNISTYLLNAQILNILTVPVIWFCIFPAVFMDFSASLYQFICFKIYHIPKVKEATM